MALWSHKNQVCNFQMHVNQRMPPLSTLLYSRNDISHFISGGDALALGAILHEHTDTKLLKWPLKKEKYCPHKKNDLLDST